MSLILVGNGASACDADLGEAIDSFETIVRFSWFWIKGFEEKVGTRTDVWATTIYDKTRLAENDFDLVICHTWQWDPDKDKTFRLLQQAHSNVVKTQRHTLHEMQDFVGCPEYLFSTGAIAAWIFLKDYDEITLTGFDWAKGMIRERHHYGDKQVRGGIHDPSHEFTFFENLQKQGKINYLQP